MTTPATFRKLALALLEVEELPHRERSSFRVNNKIFATLAEGEREAVLKLEVAHQQSLLESAPQTFMLVGWEAQGWTGVRLTKIKQAELRALLGNAWRNVAPKRLLAALNLDEAD